MAIEPAAWSADSHGYRDTCAATPFRSAISSRLRRACLRDVSGRSAMKSPLRMLDYPPRMKARPVQFPDRPAIGVNPTWQAATFPSRRALALRQLTVSAPTPGTTARKHQIDAENELKAE